MEEMSIALVGIGGYGGIYIENLLANEGEKSRKHKVRLVAGIDPYAERTPNSQTLREAGIPIYADLGSFLVQRTADLVIVSAAIHLHLPLTRMALEHGSHVLCEKPLCATISEAREMLSTAKATGKVVAVGYQWSFSAAVQRLKKDILDGKLGKPVRLKTLVLWPRTASYYARNDWAGAVKSKDGNWVLDSPMHNATAHYLHNMLYLIGAEMSTSAYPSEVQAECYRANAIENFDAAALRCRMGDGIEVLFFTAHSVPKLIGPVFQYEFEKAVVEYLPGNDPSDLWHRTFISRFKDGSVKDYGDPNEDDGQKLWQTIEAIRTRNPGGIACGIEAATPEVVCVNAARLSGEIVDFPMDLIHIDAFDGENGVKDSLTWVEGLQEAFDRCYNENMLPFEMGDIPWAVQSKLIRTKKFKGI